MDAVKQALQFAMVEKIVNDHFHSLGLPPPASDTTGLRDAGLASLQVVDLIFLLEDGLDVRIPDAEVTPQSFHSIRTIGDMLSRISAPLA